MKYLKYAAIILAGLLAVVIVSCSLKKPSLNRNWTVDQAILPYAEFNGDQVTVHNIRNFDYRSESEFTPRYYDKTFDLRELDSVWFVVEPFGSWQGPAHTFVTFGFRNRDYVAISVEIRKEVGESFSALKGTMREYELSYVVGDERDLIKLRSNFRKDDVYLYPVRTSKERMRRMFVEMLARANKLRREPEFYNSIANTCTTNIVRHVNAITPRRVPWRLPVFLPGYSDRLAYEIGLIDTNLPFEEARAKFKINERAMKYANDPQFSQRIRIPERSEAGAQGTRRAGDANVR